MNAFPSSSPVPRWTEKSRTRVLGVVMIVKNEAGNLPDLFASVADLADEVVVVDTGSTDGTLAVCKEWGVTLLQDRWRDDFSRARNRGIRAATARHLLWLDADDRVPEDSMRTLATLRDEELARRADRAYELIVRNISPTAEIQGSFSQLRIFPRLRGIEFRNRVHEQIVESIIQRGIATVSLDCVLHHTGYSSREVVLDKARRNENLLREILVESPGDVQALVHLAQAVAEAHRFQEADAIMTDALSSMRKSSSREALEPELRLLRATYRLSIGNLHGAIYDLEAAAETRPNWGLPHAFLAEAHATQGEWDAAVRSAERARTGEPNATRIAFAAERAHSNAERIAGMAALRRDDREAALAAFERAVELDETNVTARLDLGQALLDLERFAPAREILEPLGNDERALTAFVDVCTAIAFARVATGEPDAGAACLAPLLNIFSDELNRADDVGPLELAEACMRRGHLTAARNLIGIAQLVGIPQPA